MTSIPIRRGIKNGFFLQSFDQTNSGYLKSKKGKKSKWLPGDQECPFAHETQKLEARVVLDIVCKEIELRHPNIPLFTLHDCLFTIPEDV